MTTLTPITNVADSWVNNDPKRRGQNYGAAGGADRVQVQSGERRGFIRPLLPALLTGRTVLDAYLVAHSAGTAAQTLTLAPVTERWQAGKVTWANQPSVDGSRSVSAAVPVAADKAAVTIPGLAPLVQAVADGTDWYGLRISTSAASAQAFYATDSGKPAWELHVVVSDFTDTPSGLRPDGGAVGTARPVLAWEGPDQVARRVQVDTPAVGAEPDPVAPDFDTQLQTSTVTELDLATTTHTPAGAGPHYWRVQVRAEGDDTEPQWSDWASYTVAGLPALVVDSPVGAFGDPTPTLAAHLSGTTLSHWKAMVTGPDRADVRAVSELQTGPISWQVPETSRGRRVLVEGGWFNLRAWDTVERAVGVGQPDYVEVWFPVAFADSLGVQAPTSLLVTQPVRNDPRHLWQWQRTEAADAWLITVDGRIAARLDASDVTAEGGFYSWTDHGQIPPHRAHTLAVHAIEGDARSKPITRDVDAYALTHVWFLADDDSIGAMRLLGNAVSEFANVSRYTRYETLEGPPVDITYDPNPGTQGRFNGGIDARDGRTPEDVYAVLDQVEALRVAPTKTGQLVWGTKSIRVRLVDPDQTPTDNFDRHNLSHHVRFDLVELV